MQARQGSATGYLIITNLKEKKMGVWERRRERLEKCSTNTPVHKAQSQPGAKALYFDSDKSMLNKDVNTAGERIQHQAHSGCVHVFTLSG